MKHVTVNFGVCQDVDGERESGTSSSGYICSGKYFALDFGLLLFYPVFKVLVISKSLTLV